MPKLNQRGVIHLLIPIILLIGLIAGVYLVTSGNPLKLFSRASLSKPAGPETSFTLVGPSGCTAGILCALYGQHVPSEEFAVKLYARSDIETANLFTAKMTFPKDLVEITTISTDGSFVKNWVENFYDNNTGEISLTGGVPSPGYQTTVGGESGLMATITFRAKALGKGSVSFTDASAIYSNLNNINVLTIKRGYDISVEIKPSISAPISPAPTPTCRPRPACLDTTPRCMMPEPISGWCPTPTALPVPSNKGDGNNDGTINLIDMSVIHTDWMKTSKMANFHPGIDMNDDGVINSFDYSLHRKLLLQLGVIKTR